MVFSTKMKPLVTRDPKDIKAQARYQIAAERAYNRGGWAAVKRMRTKPPKILLCSCGQLGELGPDPYHSDINGDDSPVVLCTTCHNTLCQEI